jgi:hypothetical protein
LDAVRGIDRRLHGDRAAERMADELGGSHPHPSMNAKSACESPRSVGSVMPFDDWP